MRTTRRRVRKPDPLATVEGVRAVCEQLQGLLPDLIPRSEKKLWALLHAVRHLESYPAKENRGGRPSPWRREDLLEVARGLRAILERETRGRVSISSFVGLYLRILRFPSDIQGALDRSEVTLQEATILARLTPERLEVSVAEATATRHQILAAHLKAQGSQSSLRERVKEVLGEANLVSGETMASTVQKVDQLLEVDPEDKRHLFYEEMKNLFYAMREIEPEDVDEKAMEAFSDAADRLASVIYSIQQKRKKRGKREQKFYL